jgi:hypothetical protein
MLTAGAPHPRPLQSQVHRSNICGPLVHPAPDRCILSSMEETFVDRCCAPCPRPLHSQVHGGNICGPLVHHAPGRGILRSMEQTSMDRWRTSPQAAAFSGPWSKHLWTAGAPRPRPLHSQVHGANIHGPVHPAQPQAAAFSGP